MRVLLSIALAALTAQLVSPATAQSRYDNPVDQKTYVTTGSFKTYQPDSPRDIRGQRITTQHVMLLTAEPELKARVKVEDLAAYIKVVQARAYAELARNKSAMAALVQFNCHPKKCEVKLSTQGEAEGAILQALYDALSKVPPLRTTGEVIFQVTFNVDS